MILRHIALSTDMSMSTAFVWIALCVCADLLVKELCDWCRLVSLLCCNELRASYDCCCYVERVAS